jgi:hypothetical protein
MSDESTTSRLESTIGSEWMTADLKSELADGTASSARTSVAPLLCPANVMVERPPKNDATVMINFIAFITSLTAKFVRPSGDMKPSCGSSVRKSSLS